MLAAAELSLLQDAAWVIAVWCQEQYERWQREVSALRLQTWLRYEVARRQVDMRRLTALERRWRERREAEDGKVRQQAYDKSAVGKVNKRAGKVAKVVGLGLGKAREKLFAENELGRMFAEQEEMRKREAGMEEKEADSKAPAHGAESMVTGSGIAGATRTTCRREVLRSPRAKERATTTRVTT